MQDYDAQKYFEARLQIEKSLASAINTLYDTYRGNRETCDALVNTLDYCISVIDVCEGRKQTIL